MILAINQEMHKIEYVIKKYGFEAVQVMNAGLYKWIKKKNGFNTFLYYVKLHFFFVLLPPLLLMLLFGTQPCGMIHNLVTSLLSFLSNFL